MQRINVINQALIEYLQLKDKLPADRMIFIIVDKENNEILRVIEHLNDVEKAFKDLEGHYKGNRLHFDGVKLQDLKEIMPINN